MPWWILAITAALHVVALLWAVLVIRDTDRFVDGQLWVVSDEYVSSIRTWRLRWIRRLYLLNMLFWIPISFILLYL
jgi:hypothetical protein